MMNFLLLERNFTGIGCTMEAQTTLSNSTQCGLFIGEYKKYTVSGVALAFNIAKISLFYYNKQLTTNVLLTSLNSFWII